MCGFAGEFIFGGEGRADPALAEAMVGRCAHRGPDEAGVFFSPDGRCAIGCRRLAVIDPPLSHQPMAAADGSAVVAFNGQIYNFRALRERLAGDGCTFSTRGDTEVLLALWERCGEAMLDQLEGMFAFVVYDARNGRLFMARDRLGQKPLWYAVTGGRIVFASEAKALLVHPRVNRVTDPAAVASYLTVGYVPAPGSIWRGIVKLPAAHCMTVAAAPAEPRRYWTLPVTAEKANEPGAPPAIADERAAEQVRQTLTRAVSARMAADVPLGALLSGGVDSSIVVALMCKAAGAAGGVKTFTAGFAEGSFDERRAAAEVAAHLGTDHKELLVSPSQFDVPALLEKLVNQYDEPFADSSALPTYLICRAAREHVTVALTGDGGDEAFGGYDRYRAMRLAQTMGPAGWAMTRLAAGLAALAAPHDERSALRRFVRFASAMNEPPSLQYFAYRRLFGPDELANILQGDFAREARVASPREWFCRLYEQGDFDDDFAYAQRHDLLTYLPDDLLVKADIASMASSLELRSPMLDHEVVSLGLTLPVGLKLQGRRGKAVLGRVFADLLPKGVFTRPKRGFGAPIHRWLKNELRGTLQETLLDGPLVSLGWMSQAPLERMINDHLTGKADHRHRLWALLWLGRWLAGQGK